MYDLHQIATENSQRLIEQYHEIREKINEGKMARFCDFFSEHFCLSINMNDTSLCNFLSSGRYLNMFELKNKQVEILKESGREVNLNNGLKKGLKEYYIKRTIFCETFIDAERFNYAALNIGGLGTKYGSYCIIINRDQNKIFEKIVYAMNDSLNYVESEVDIENFTKEISNDDDVFFLTVIKHHEDIENSDIYELPKKVCYDEIYIEAIIQTEITPDNIFSIRTSKKHDEQFKEYLFQSFMNELEPFNNYQLSTYLIIQDLLQSNHILYEVLDSEY